MIERGWLVFGWFGWSGYRVERPAKGGRGPINLLLHRLLPPHLYAVFHFLLASRTATHSMTFSVRLFVHSLNHLRFRYPARGLSSRTLPAPSLRNTSSLQHPPPAELQIDIMSEITHPTIKGR